MELTAIEPQAPRRRLWFQLILFLCFIACLVVGLSSLAALLLLRGTNSPLEQSTSLPAIDASSVVPGIALNQLAGDPPQALALQAASAGEFSTAQAILAFDVKTPEGSKLGLFQLLSRKLSESDLTEQARRSQVNEIQRQARRIAVLVPSLDIPQRSQLLIQGSQDLLRVDDAEAAYLSAINLQRLAEQMPELLPAQRRQMLEPLSPLLTQIGSPELEQRVDELLRNPFLEPMGELLPLQLTELLGNAPAPDPSIAAAILARQEAARLLVAQIYGQPQDQAATNALPIDSLANLLQSENLIRQQVTQSLLADASNPPEAKLHILHELYQWTLLKASVATGGFGLSLVEEWEANISGIEQELTALAMNIDQTTDAVMETALAEPQEKAALRVEKFLWLALIADRGLYPGASVEGLGNDLRFAQTELANQGIDLALPVFLDTSLDRPEFQIQARQ